MSTLDLRPLTLYHLVCSMRPKQWTKNLLLFAGIVFSHNFHDFDLVLRVVIAFCLFCLLSGSIYIFNDLVDIEADRLHPLKKNRPLAARLIKRRVAFSWAAIISVGALISSYLLSPEFFLAAFAYYTLTLLYSYVFKHIAIIDVILLASGFVLRAIAGVLVIREAKPDVPLTPWFIICILFLSLFVAICKRRHELMYVDDAANHRKVLEEYSPAFLDQMIATSTSATIISYALYLIQGPHGALAGAPDIRIISTLPFVIYGVFRYLYLVYKRGEGGDPENLILKDKPFLANVVIWLILMVTVMQ